MLLDMSTGACFRLNAVGAELWQLLVEGNTVGSAIQCLSSRYNVSRDMVETDAFRLCADLVAARLVSSPQRVDGG